MKQCSKAILLFSYICFFNINLVTLTYAYHNLAKRSWIWKMFYKCSGPEPDMITDTKTGYLDSGTKFDTSLERGVWGSQCTTAFINGPSTGSRINFQSFFTIVGLRGLMVKALDCSAKCLGFKSHGRILFLGEFLKQKRKKQRNKMLWLILLLGEKEN